MSDNQVNILLVDDQPGKLLTYEAILSELGENLIKASSGAEALEHLLKTEIAVVLLDVCMPNIDGFELAALVRQHPRCQKTAIIFISAIASTDIDRLKGYRYGAVDYVSVPVEPELLRARVSLFADLYRKTQALERMNRELERRVAERTAELEADLAARKVLEAALTEASRRKDQFLAMLSHELRNPLAPIRSAIEIMKRKALDDPDVRDCRDLIDRQVRHLVRLVDDLLDVARVTNGKLKLDMQPIDVASVVEGAVEANRSLLDERRQQLTLTLPKGRLTIMGDLTRLCQVVGNLLNNAAKYTGEGGQLALRVETELNADDEAQVVIRVSDTGRGIPPEMLPSVFDLFTQVDDSLDRSQGGLGIGLALVRRIVTMHHGTIEARSDGLGMGSEFILRLPIDRVRRPSHPQAITADANSAQLAIATRRILVVDDNRDSAEALAMLLRMDGGEVETAYDGAEALAAAERFHPDMMLLDIGMPDLDGYAVARSIRSQPWGARIVLVAQTGWGQDEDRRRALEAGFDAHMTKPVDYTKLVALMADTMATAEPLGTRSSA